MRLAHLDGQGNLMGAIHLDSARFSTNTLFGFAIHTGQDFNSHTLVIEASEDLRNWQPIHTNTPPAVLGTFIDTDARRFPQRFYRIRAR